MIHMPYPLKYVFLFLLIFVFALVAMGSQKPPQRCTAIQVPTSTGFPVVMIGQRFETPSELSQAFKPVLNTIELPKGYRAVGGGAGMVIACTE